MKIPQPLFHTKPKHSYEVRKHDSLNLPLLLSYQCEWGIDKLPWFWPGSSLSTLSINQLVEGWKPDVTFPLKRNARNIHFQAKHLIMVYQEFYCELSKYQIVGKQSSDLDQYNVQSGVYKNLPVTCTGFGSGLLYTVFKYKLCTFKIMSCISRQIYNNRNIRLGDALGCSLACPWTGSPVKILVYVYLYCSESLPMIKSLPRHSVSMPHS